MRISELADASGVPVATIKFYLRDGLLPAGEHTSATRASYGPEHLRRLRLVRSLVEVGGMPLAKVRAVLDAIDDPPHDPYDAVSRALEAVPPYVSLEPPYLRAEAALNGLGLDHEPGSAAVAQLEAALRYLDDAGRPLDQDALARYAADLTEIARREVADVEPDRDAAPGNLVEDVVLGTVLVEPVILALRRLVHAALFRERHRQP